MNASNRWLLTALVLIAGSLRTRAADEPSMAACTGGVVWCVSPMAGWNRDTLEMRGPMGEVLSETDTAPEYGLFALTMGYRWRMLEAGVNYYYQDSQDLEEDFQVVRARFNCFFSRTWGLAARFDYAEHQITDDKSVLLGPVWVF